MAEPSTFSGSSAALAVEVPVQVLQNGEPVRGLGAADFELYDGRKKVAITGFDVLDLGATSGAASRAPMPVAARRHFLLLFDLTFSDPASISRGRAAAKTMLGALDPADLVAVATYSITQGPQLIVGFTPDRRQVEAGIETLGLPAFFHAGTDPLRLVMPTTSMANGGPAPANGTLVPTSDAQFQTELSKVTAVGSRGDRNGQLQAVRSLTSSFTNLAHSLAAIAGRKYVVYLSEGFDSSLLVGERTAQAAEMNDLEAEIEDAGDPLQDADSDPGSGSNGTFGDTRTQNSVESMLEEFRRANCQIEAVDVGGLRAPGEQGLQHTKGRDSLLNMAKSTGGELIENSNDLGAAMAQMLHRTGVTYVLSFQPEKLVNDGSFHKVKVELKNGAHGARLVHRAGYYAPGKGPRQPIERYLAAADAVMGDERGTLDMSVLAAPFAASGDRAYVPVVIEVPGAQLMSEKAPTKIPLEIYAYAVDGNGAVQGFLTDTLSVDGSKNADLLRKSGVKYYGHVDLPVGSYALRTLVRDAATGASAVRVTPLTVSAGGASTLLPAFFPEEQGRWMMVRETQPQQATVDYPFMLGGQPYVPTARPPLATGQPLAVVVQGYNLPVGSYRASASVLSLDGKEVPGAHLSMKKSEGGSNLLRLSGTLQAPPLAKGEYLLRVTLTDGSGATHTSTSRFEIDG